MIPQPLFFSVSLTLLLTVLGFLLIQPGLMKNSERLGFPTFAALGKGIPALRNSILRLMGGYLYYQSFDYLGRCLLTFALRKSAAAGSRDGGGLRELKVLPVTWYDELARILTVVEDTGVWPDGLLDADIGMILKVDGDATPLGQRPLSAARELVQVLGS